MHGPKHAPWRPVIAAASRWRRRRRVQGLAKDLPQSRGRPMVVGFLNAPSGIGSGGRLLFEAFEAAGLDPAAHDLTARFAPEQKRLSWAESKTRPDDGGGPVVFHVNAPETPLALSTIGAARLRGRLRIGYWAWEFERLPKAWKADFFGFHEIWAPSAFTAAAIAEAAPKLTVRSVGYAFAPPEPAASAVASWRSQLAPQGERLILSAFDFRSSLDRKNPEGAIAAFKSAFENRQDVAFALKVTSWTWRPDLHGRILEAIGSDPRIRLLTDSVSDASLTALLAATDIYLSLHRSEGFGLMLAASLMAGAEVVLTGWSGSEDFADLPGCHRISADFVPAADSGGVYGARVGRWAAPRLEEAAAALRGLADAPRSAARRDMIAAAAADRFSVDRFMERAGPVFARHAAIAPSGERL